MMARKPDEADAGFAIGVYDQGMIESNADVQFGLGRHVDPRDRAWAEEEGLFNNDSGTKEGTITAKGWDLLNDDIAKIEKNAMAWMKRKFLDARDEGHGGHGGEELIGTFWFDPRNADQAQLVDLAADTGRQERIDFVDTSFGDFGDTAFDGVSKFGGLILGGGITFFDVKPEDMEVVEDTLWRASHGGRPLERGQRAQEASRRPRGGWWVHWNNQTENGPFDSRSEAKTYADYWRGQSRGKLTFKIDQVPGHDERSGPRPATVSAPSARQSDWEVVVGNIGSVYRGGRSDEAVSTYREYVKQSQSGRGRAGGEPVTLFRDGEIYREHMGSNEGVEERRPRRPPPPRPTSRRRPPPARRR
jgi:hypothetical protein